MPFFRKNRRRNVARKPTALVRVTAAPRTLAQEKRLILNTVRKQAQKKEIDYEIAKVVFTNGTPLQSIIFQDLTFINQGDQMNTREGNSLHMSWLHYRFSGASNDTEAKRVRVMVVQDKDPGSTALDVATWTNLYMTSAFVPQGVTQLQGDLIRPINQNVVNVLYDRSYLLLPKTEGSTMRKGKVRINKRLSYPIGATVDTYNGSIYFIAALIEQDTVASANTAVLTAFLRVFFKDSSSAVKRG